MRIALASRRLPLATWAPAQLPRRAMEATLLIVLSYGVWTWSTPTKSPTAPVSADSIGVTKPDTGHTADSVAEMHLFGMDPAAAGPAVPRIEPVVEIAGILAAESEQDSVALLQVAGEAKPYQVNDRLADGEVVEHIESAAVVLGDAGRTRRIEMAIKYADSNAVFRKAGLEGGKGSSWADAYGEDDSQQADAASNRVAGGIAHVAATNSSRAPGISLRAIREARSAHFPTIGSGRVAPPTPASTGDGND